MKDDSQNTHTLHRPPYSEHYVRVHKNKISTIKFVIIVLLIVGVLFALAELFPSHYTLPAWMTAGLDPNAPPVDINLQNKSG